MHYQVKRTERGEWVMDGVWKRGQAVLLDPLLNKGTAFSYEEREVLGIEGMLPHQITTEEEQVSRAYQHIVAKGDNPLEKYVGMVSLQDRNETLFYQIMASHVAELTPIVYTPTVGDAAVKFSHLFRRGRGLWITPNHKGRMHQILSHVRNDGVRLIVVTDNERILGLGDQGAGGMVIPIGKLALYTLGAGIHPAFTLPISLDFGTDNEGLLADPLYVGWRGKRVRGELYQELIAEFIDAVKRRWPEALLQWEDFKKANAFALLDRYQDELPSFNDDIQGTAAVTTAGVVSYCRAVNQKLEDQLFVLYGAGAAGVGIARLLRHKLEEAGISGPDLHRKVILLDSHGLVTDDREDLEAFKRAVACPAELADESGVGAGADLVAVIEKMKPTVLIGTTGQPGVFTELVLKTLGVHAERPVVMALSNPTSMCEAIPSDIANATDGRAFMATGSPFDPVAFGGRMLPVSQCNNVYIFPGVGLGAIVAKARKVTESMFGAAADALAMQVHESDIAAGRLYPPLADLRKVTRKVAGAVAAEASRCGAARPMTEEEIEAGLDAQIWDLRYPRLIPV